MITIHNTIIKNAIINKGQLIDDNTKESKKDLVKDMEVDLKFHDGDAKAKIL